MLVLIYKNNLDHLLNISSIAEGQLPHTTYCVVGSTPTRTPK